MTRPRLCALLIMEGQSGVPTLGTLLWLTDVPAVHFVAVSAVTLGCKGSSYLSSL